MCGRRCRGLPKAAARRRAGRPARMHAPAEVFIFSFEFFFNMLKRAARDAPCAFKQQRCVARAHRGRVILGVSYSVCSKCIAAAHDGSSKPRAGASQPALRGARPIRHGQVGAARGSAALLRGGGRRALPGRREHQRRGRPRARRPARLGLHGHAPPAAPRHCAGPLRERPSAGPASAAAMHRLHTSQAWRCKQPVYGHLVCDLMVACSLAEQTWDVCIRPSMVTVPGAHTQPRVWG